MRDIYEDAPPGLPEPQFNQAAASKKSAARVCSACDVEMRVFSVVGGGLRAACPKCRVVMSISLHSAQELPMTPIRGLQRKTIVEPDYSEAFEDDAEGT